MVLGEGFVLMGMQASRQAGGGAFARFGVLGTGLKGLLGTAGLEWGASGSEWNGMAFVACSAGGVWQTCL
jgi:hypothetical protein